jgi:hypothetical protein
MKIPNQSTGLSRETFTKSMSMVGVHASQSFTSVVTPEEVAPGSWCCDEGANPIDNPEQCRQLLFGRFGICLRYRWNCGSHSCTSQFTSTNALSINP